ncbi:hypothetical protein Bhyg_09834 [Pseudolycoriella hygida]|uniref:Uncharacterized protein n=1 Tax=Pseudolycoriella hygida TaxID=35572 RepID=A0A9Q0RYL8_9DIPT|nr:hypothetical protein Bhyg_09834 [Pseudolycoriella hygida]
MGKLLQQQGNLRPQPFHRFIQQDRTTFLTEHQLTLVIVRIPPTPVIDLSQHFPMSILSQLFQTRSRNFLKLSTIMDSEILPIIITTPLPTEPGTGTAHHRHQVNTVIHRKITPKE